MSITMCAMCLQYLINLYLNTSHTHTSDFPLNEYTAGGINLHNSLSASPPSQRSVIRLPCDTCLNVHHLFQSVRCNAITVEGCPAIPVVARVSWAGRAQVVPVCHNYGAQMWCGSNKSVLSTENTFAFYEIPKMLFYLSVHHSRQHCIVMCT